MAQDMVLAQQPVHHTAGKRGICVSYSNIVFTSCFILANTVTAESEALLLPIIRSIITTVRPNRLAKIQSQQVQVAADQALALARRHLPLLALSTDIAVPLMRIRSLDRLLTIIATGQSGQRALADEAQVANIGKLNYKAFFILVCIVCID